MIKKPLNLDRPPKVDFKARYGSSVAEFQATFASFQISSRSARTSRQSAQEMASMVDQALSEVQKDINDE